MKKNLKYLWSLALQYQFDASELREIIKEKIGTERKLSFRLNFSISVFFFFFHESVFTRTHCTVSHAVHLSSFRVIFLQKTMKVSLKTESRHFS